MNKCPSVSQRSTITGFGFFNLAQRLGFTVSQYCMVLEIPFYEPRQSSAS